MVPCLNKASVSRSQPFSALRKMRQHFSTILLGDILKSEIANKKHETTTGTVVYSGEARTRRQNIAFQGLSPSVNVTLFTS